MTSKVDLSTAADQCVMCGMCLPQCPTYQVSHHEAESPRGRISLIKALYEGKLAPSKGLEEHIQSCTGCLRCQQVCPANVDYQTILDTGRSLYRSQQSVASRLLHTASIEAATHAWGHTAIRLISHMTNQIPSTNRRIGLLKYASASAHDNPANSPHQSTVNVFAGCTGTLFDRQTLRSLIQLLNAIGVHAKLPNAIMCCGALSQHSGVLTKAQQNMSDLQRYLSEQSSNILLSFASGCGRQLNEQLADSKVMHFDAMHWLSIQKAFNDIKFSDTPKRVLIHHPCTQETSHRQRTYYMLERLPNIELLEFNDEFLCCGAGGLQLISPQPSNERLLDKKIAIIRSTQPDMIISSNIGCSLNYRLGLETNRLDIEVIHPLTLLARQMIV